MHAESSVKAELQTAPGGYTPEAGAQGSGLPTAPDATELRFRQ